MATWAERIKVLRERLGFSRKKLADLLHTTFATIARWENGLEPRSNCDEMLVGMIEAYPEHALGLLSELIERRKLLTFGESEGIPERLDRVSKNLGLSRRELARLLGVSYEAIGTWYRGQREMTGCPGVMLDLLDFHLQEAAPLLWPDFAWQSIEEPGGDDGETDTGREPEREIEWPPARVLLLRESLGLSNQEFANLFHTQPSATSRWLSNQSSIGACNRLLLHLLETHGPRAADLMESIHRSEPSWTPENVQDLRHMMSLTEEGMAELLGPELGPRFKDWERTGPPSWFCSSLLFSLLQAYPEEMVELLRSLPKEA